MLALQIYAPRRRVADVAVILGEEPGVDHVVEVGETVGSDLVYVTADVSPGVVDTLLPKLVACGVSGEQISILHLDGNRPLGTARVGDVPSWSGGPLAWTELAMASRQYARAVPQYLVFMMCAGVIAAFGVLTRNPILIVGAMAISPDLLPLCATCVGIVHRHPRLARRAFAAVVIGLLVAGIAAFVVTAALRAGGYAQAQGSLGSGGLGVLPTVNAATFGVAIVAGIAGILSFETRSSSAVGVAISITTIPAASYAGAAFAVGDIVGARGALAVLGVNVVTLIATGTLTLLVQRGLLHRRA
jgi:uncharacterized hydrophobic protein (TIGR00271 family)